MHHALTESVVTENLESFILLHVSHGYDSLSPQQMRCLCAASLQFSRVRLHKSQEQAELFSSHGTGRFPEAFGTWQTQVIQAYKIISSCTPSFSGICYLPNWQMEQKFYCSLTSAASSESSETGSVCALAVPASMQNTNGNTVPSHGEQEQKEEANPFLDNSVLRARGWACWGECDKDTGSMISLALTEPPWCVPCPVTTEKPFVPVCSVQGAAWYLVPFSRYSHKNVPSKLQIGCLVAGGLCTEHQACSSACGEQQSDARITLNEQIPTKCMQLAV